MVINPISKNLGIGWKLLQNRAGTDDALQEKGIKIVSCCRTCYSEAKNLQHISWTCPFALALWNWARDLFCVPMTIISFQEAFQLKITPVIISKDYGMQPLWRLL